ncbi:MAG: hypothetical protein U1E38_08600 [Rhodospirillales bacterium]
MPAGLEAALAAALGDDVLAGCDPAAPAFWRPLPAYDAHRRCRTAPRRWRWPSFRRRWCGGWATSAWWRARTTASGCRRRCIPASCW